jgi:hypothetical protein
MEVKNPMKIMKDKQGNLKSIAGLFLTLFGIMILAGSTLLSGTTFRDSFTVGTAEYNATDNIITGVQNITTNFGTFGTLVGVAVIVIGAFFIIRSMGSRSV